MNSQAQGQHILVIAPTPFFADRGCHVRILEEMQATMPLGHQFTVCTYHLGRDINGIDIRRSLNVPWYNKLSAGPSIHKLYLDFFLLLTVMFTCFRKKPAIIHAHLHEGVLIGKIASLCFGIPLIADIQGSLTGELLQHRFVKEGGIFYRFFQWIENLIIGMPDYIFSSFTQQLTTHKKTAQSIQNKIKHIADGVDTKQFCPDLPSKALREKLGISKEVKIVGFLGVLTEYQGVSVLLEAVSLLIKQMPHVHFLIMGYPNVEHYQAKAEALGISASVTFSGRIAYEEAPQYLSICDLLISPKFHTTEANGKLLNYMAMGIPVVASDSPVNLDILGTSGIYAEEGNPKSFSDAIYRVLSDDELASKSGRQLRERAIEHYSWQAIGLRISEVYQNLAQIKEKISPQND